MTRLGDLPSGVNSVEGIALSLDGSTLYAVNDKLDQGYFGTIDKTTGNFRQIGIIGPGHGIDPVTGAPITRSLNEVYEAALKEKAGVPKGSLSPASLMR